MLVFPAPILHIRSLFFVLAAPIRLHLREMVTATGCLKRPISQRNTGKRRKRGRKERRKGRRAMKEQERENQKENDIFVESFCSFSLISTVNRCVFNSFSLYFSSCSLFRRRSSNYPTDRSSGSPYSKVDAKTTPYTPRKRKTKIQKRGWENEKRRKKCEGDGNKKKKERMKERSKKKGLDKNRERIGTKGGYHPSGCLFSSVQLPIANVRQQKRWNYASLTSTRTSRIRLVRHDRQEQTKTLEIVVLTLKPA